jgi:type I restriction enzyme R subunit
VPRLERATKAELKLLGYDKAKQVFLNFVLEQYVKKGVNELDDTRIKGLLELKYKSISDAKGVLGDIKSIRESFIGFQKYLYEDEVVNNYEDLGMVAEPELEYGE